MRYGAGQGRWYVAGFLLLTPALACSGRVADSEPGGSVAGAMSPAGTGGTSVVGPADGGSAGTTSGPGGTSNHEPRGGSGDGGAIGGTPGSRAGADGADAGKEEAGGEASAGSAGEEVLPALRWLLLEPPPPPSTPEGVTPDEDRNFSTRYCCSSADASVIVGFSTYVFPRFSSEPFGETERPFIWREQTGVKELGLIDDPLHRRVIAIEPEYVTADGERILGSFAVVEVGPGGTQPVWSTALGGFFAWTEAQGYTRFGPSEPVLFGQINAYSADGKTALGQVESYSNTWSDFRWTEAEGYTLLADLPGWPADAQALTMSRDGTSILGVSNDFLRGFRWRKSGVQWFGALDPSRVCSPEVISATGAVIAGTCQDSNGVLPPLTFRWSEASGLAALDPNSQFQFSPTEVSDSGDVLLGREGVPDTLLRGLAYWEAGSGIRRQIPNPDTQSRYLITSHSLTADGSAAIGMHLLDDSKGQGFQWTRSGGVHELPGLSAADYAFPTSQSADGRLIAGSAGNNAVIWDSSGIRDLRAELRRAGIDQKGWALNAALGVTAVDSIVTYGSSLKTVSTSSWAEQRVWVAWLRAR